MVARVETAAAGAMGAGELVRLLVLDGVGPGFLVMPPGGAT